MEAKEFVRTVNRICGSNNMCETCPLCNVGCYNADSLMISESVVDAVETWAKEHHIKTNEDKMNETFGKENWMAAFVEIPMPNSLLYWLGMEYKEPQIAIEMEVKDDKDY